MGGPVILWLFFFLGCCLLFLCFFFYRAAHTSVNKGVNWCLHAGILMKKLPSVFLARLPADAERESGVEAAAGAASEATGHSDGSRNRTVIDG